MSRSPATMPEACELLSWDTDFWGFRIARALRDDPDAIDEWCRSHDIRCVYLLAAPHRGDALGRAGFDEVDARVTFARAPVPLSREPGSSARGGVEIRPSEPDDVERLRAIAAMSHTDSRFYADPGFPNERCDEFYQTWITNSCDGYAREVLVAVEGGAPVGYVTCHRADDVGSIGLIAVDDAHRGRGIGRQLTDAALDWAAREGCARMEVVTQGRNEAARGLYLRCGFTVADEQTWFHKWYG